MRRKFAIEVGRYDDCGGRVQGRHELQTSDATSAAKSQLGAKAHALTTWLRQRLGLSYGKVQEFLQTVFGVKTSRATCCRSIAATAKRCAVAGETIRRSIRGSPWIVPDETGWRVGGNSA